MPNNKYNQLKRQYSLDGGLTWHDLLPMVYKVGNVIETNSDCTDSDGCRWVVLPITEAYDCDTNYNMYQVEAEECLNQYGVFVRSGNIRRYRLIEDYSIACGYSGPICTPTSITSSTYDIVYNGGDVEWNEVATPVVYKITTITDIDKGCNETSSSSNREEITDYTISYSPSGDNTTEEDRTVTATVKYEGETIGSFSYLQKGKLCEPSTSITYTNYVITYNGGEVEWNEVATPIVTATENTTITNGSCDETTTTASTEIVDYSITYSPSGDNTTTEDRTVTATITHNDNNAGDFSYNQKGLYMADPTTVGGDLIFNSSEDLTDYNHSYDIYCVNNSYYKKYYEITTETETTYLYTGQDFEESVSDSCNPIIKADLNYSVTQYGITLINFPKTDNFTSMERLFIHSGFKSLNLVNFNTSNVTNMSDMFYSANAETVDLSGWDVSNVTDMSGMFVSSELKYAKLTNWKLNNVTNISEMFRYCDSLSTLDLSGWEINDDITEYENVFSGCTSLKTVIMNNTDCETINKIRALLIMNDLKEVNIITNTSDCEINYECSDNTECGNMLVLTHECELYDWINYPPSGIYLNGIKYNNIFEKQPTINALNANTYEIDITTLEGAYPLTSVTNFISNSVGQIGKILCFPDVSNVTSMRKMFITATSGPANNSKLRCINAKGWNTSNVTDMCMMFADQFLLTDIIGIEDWDVSNVTDVGAMFFRCKSLTSLDLSKWDFSNVTNMYHDGNDGEGFTGGMFHGCSGLTSLQLPKNINVTNMSCMFIGCRSLTSLDVSNIDTSNVTDMSDMFNNCMSLTSLDLSSFNTSKVTNMGNMFIGCRSLTSLDVSNFDTSNVTDMESMFDHCMSLTSLDLSSFNTSNITNMKHMFLGCESLVSLDLSSFDTSNVTEMINIFNCCKSLVSLDLSGWNITNTTNYEYMFEKCYSLSTIYAYGCNEDTITKLNNAKPENCTLVY